MDKILDFLAQDHRACDAWLAATDTAATQREWDRARTAFRVLTDAVLAHLAREEQILFPAFEACTVNTLGPTEVMRMEHRQMRVLLHEMSTALAEPDRPRYLRLSKMFSALMQHHNLKEEDMLFPMFDRMLGDEGDALIAAMRAIETV